MKTIEIVQIMPEIKELFDIEPEDNYLDEITQSDFDNLRLENDKDSEDDNKSIESVIHNIIYDNEEIEEDINMIKQLVS